MRINYKNKKYTNTPWPKKKNNPNLDSLYFAKQVMRFLPVLAITLLSLISLYFLLPVLSFIVNNLVFVLVTVFMVLYIFHPRQYLRI